MNTTGLKSLRKKSEDGAWSKIPLNFEGEHCLHTKISGFSYLFIMICCGGGLCSPSTLFVYYDLSLI